ncbi:hypothetical protein [Clostridium algidicarnis]|uniref:hypothetical protein n=1 Tax=Clostridium algidicarnis TaxID=37659 RepID=UPI000497447A|nr:hypothetical protein [Clostridium algidicarnis]
MKKGMDLQLFAEESPETIETEVIDTTERTTETETEPNKETETLETKLKELEDREKAFKVKETEFALKTELTKANLPTELTKYLKIDKGQDLKAFVKDLGKIINNLKLEGAYVPTDKNTQTDLITKKQFKEMGYAERLNLYNTNPSLYAALSK